MIKHFTEQATVGSSLELEKIDSEQAAEERKEAAAAFIENAIEEYVGSLKTSGELDAMNAEQLLEAVTDQAGVIAIRFLKEKYENGEHPERQLAFHNSHHTEAVVRRITQLSDAITKVNLDFSLEDRSEAVLEGYFHDVDHLFEDKNGVRKRMVGRGEDYSARYLTSVKKSVNQALAERGKEALFVVDEEADLRAMATTKPTFVPGVGVIQKELTSETLLPARLLALADLGAFGLDGPEISISDCKKLSLEENSDIVVAVQSGKVFTAEEKEKYKQRLLFLLKDQANFVKSRKEQFTKDLQGVTDENVRKAIIDQFVYFKDEEFEKGVKKIEEEAARLSVLNFDDLVKEFGIQTFSMAEIKN